MRWLIYILIGLLLFGSLDGTLRAAASAPVSLSATTAGEDAPVSVPAPTARAVRHYESGLFLWAVRTVLGLAVPALFLLGGFSKRLRDFSGRFGHNWLGTLCAYFIVAALLSYVATWPLDYYQGFVRPHAYDLSNQTFAKWFGDSLKQLAIVLVLGVLFLWVPYLLLKKSPRRWWLYAGLAMVPIYFFIQLVRPVVIEPMFNRFTPLENKALETQILGLAEKAGIHGSRVYEVNKSVDTKTVNAYVTGFLGTKRIVLWDTTLTKLDPKEILFVMGHEMGHYVLGHVVKGILVLSGLTLLAFYAIHRTAGVLIHRFKGRLGFDQLSDVASLPLLVLLINFYSLVLTPVGFAYSRHLEHEADRFGLEITHYNHSAGTGFVRLLAENLGVPRPGWFYEVWFATHPSIGERIDFFNGYKPWETGQPLRYESYFQTEQSQAPAAKPQ